MNYTLCRLAGYTFIATVGYQVIAIQPAPPPRSELSSTKRKDGGLPDLQESAEEVGNMLAVTSSGDSALLTEDGDVVLTEDDGRLLLEESVPV